MANMPKRLDKAGSGQMSLFEVLRGELEAHKSPLPGSSNIKHQLLAALSDSLRNAGKSREVIADEMTTYLGEEITIHMINAWVAQSKENHRFPAEFAGAFCKATNSLKVQEVVARSCGVFTLRGPDALRADIRKLDEKKKDTAEQARRIEAEKKRLETLLQEVEGSE